MNAAWTSIDWQTHFDERAAIAEHDGALVRDEAERQAILEIYDNIGTSPPGVLGELITADRRRRDVQIVAEVDALFAHVRFPWGFGWVVPDGITYRVADRGEPASAAFIVPALEDGRLVDLVAQTLGLRGIRSRLGAASVLGADEIEAARITGRPLYVYGSIPQWLKGGARGAVVVDWSRAARELDGVATLLCSASVADQLYPATRRCVPLPLVATPTESDARLAA